MDKRILDHFQEFSQFTYPGCFKDILQKLPEDIKEIGEIVRSQIIHRNVVNLGLTTAKNKNIPYNIPWYRQAEDDNFPTVSAILAELQRRDPRGLVKDRQDQHKLILTCRFVSILMASILKSKNIPCRVRSGFAPYFGYLFKGKNADHWINQYWRKSDRRWVTIDIDASMEQNLTFDPYDLPEDDFDFSADVWLKIRQGKADQSHYFNSGGFEGLVVVAWELFYDFHCLMNNEIVYYHHPEPVLLNNFPKISKMELSEIDELAKLMQKPDDNFGKLLSIWKTNKEFRLLKGGLL